MEFMNTVVEYNSYKKLCQKIKYVYKILNPVRFYLLVYSISHRPVMWPHCKHTTLDFASEVVLLRSLKNKSYLV